MRCAGILMPIASLPSDDGVGDFGKCGYEFIDKMKYAGITIWQILPLNPLGYGNSPYQPYSSYAGDEIYISLDAMKEDGLLNEIEPYTKKCNKIDYQKVREYKTEYLKIAFKNFKQDEEYKKFISQEWLYKYAVFISLKKQNNLVCWNEWPKDQKEWIINGRYNIDFLKENIEYEMFIQYIFFKQWMKLKEYANKSNIRIMGDIPIYVGIDSSDVWSNQKCFLLDADSKPSFVAGVPPDYFSKTGQRWGNPIYDWEFIKDNNFKFWIDRLSYSSKLFDIIRIDHFRGFDTYWKIPSSCETAVEGEWIEAPGYDLFNTVLKELPNIQIVVEDLGDLRKEVHQLRDHFGFKGMSVAQFSLAAAENNNDFADRKDMIVYTGTHDNQTTRGWYYSQNFRIRKRIRDILRRNSIDVSPVSWGIIELLFKSIADIAVVTVQDIIDINDKGRINLPGFLGTPNWEWKLSDFSQLDIKLEKLKNLVEITER